MEPVRWSQSDGANQMEPITWSQSDGANQMEPIRWSQSDGANQMEPIGPLEGPFEKAPHTANGAKSVRMPGVLGAKTASKAPKR
eukprot:1184283-Prorocentrum_minimum.AAC.2